MKNPSMMRILVMILAAAAPLATANEGLLDATIQTASAPPATRT